MVESRLGVAIIGGPETVRRKLTEFLAATEVDEVIITSDVYGQKARLESFEIAAEAMKDVTAAMVGGGLVASSPSAV
jgi:alkanesulfonate monooxygenase SsuD/methylene tetrahydromethanopterin reductase-like flavin-dependent oxidoreductase (luciferase family)